MYLFPNKASILILLDGLEYRWGGFILCGILLYVMDKNSVFHLKMGRGGK
jgi:hypothetical protein